MDADMMNIKVLCQDTDGITGGRKPEDTQKKVHEINLMPQK
jgi:hypothetical protein